MEFLDNIPDILYKYRCWDDPYQKRILTDNEIYLASADQFNDPFDSTLPYRFIEDDLTPENIYIKLHELGREQWPNISEEELQQKCYERQMSGIFENGQYWKGDYEDHKKEMNTKFGILSLTSKNSNLLMWSHYSNSHRGFCIGFDKYILFKVIYGTLGPVIYSNEFPSVGLFDKNFQGLARILMTKSKDWEYEDEYRVTKIDSARQVFKFPNEAVKEIILGYKMEDDYKDEIGKLARQKFPNSTIYESQMNLEQFKLDMIPFLKG